MKKFSNITILLLSISFASAPVLARQAVDDYIGYTHSMNNPAEHMRHERSTDDTSRYVRQRHSADTAAEFARDVQNANDREARRVGKLLWESDHVQGDHSKWSGAKMLEWPLLWKSGHAQGELEWPLLWKISHVQGSHGNVN